MTTALALFDGPIHAWSIVEILIACVIIAAAIGIAYIAFQVFGVVPPPWAVKMFWIVVCAFVAIFCIRLIAGM